MEAILTNVLSIIGEDTRAKVLLYLMDGRYYTARELALMTNNSPQGMSNHLKKLLDARLIKVEVQGRNRYFQLDRPEIAYAVEGLIHLIPDQLTRDKPGNGDIAFARTCYNHLAGYLGVILCESFLEQGLIIRDDRKFIVTPFGREWFLGNGFKLEKASLKLQVCSHTACLDWTERRFHIGGALGADLLNYFLENGSFRKKSNERTLVLTPHGEKAFRRLAVHIYK